ncbi:hypothetical protein HKCCE3408_17580 [Rhodobacterales bacterium HKCCE3408]|nr:hypothetical protein [Rhodobacterales bacterium HKCCE3408]
MTPDVRNRLFWWHKALGDAGERLHLVKQLPDDDTQTPILALALQESAVMAVMRVFGPFGKKGPEMASNDDDRLTDLRSRLIAETATALDCTKESIDGLLERTRYQRNNIVAHASGAKHSNINAFALKVGTSTAIITNSLDELYLDESDYEDMEMFADAACEILHGWLWASGAASDDKTPDPL